MAEVARWEGSKGKVVCWRRSPRVTLVRMEGHMAPEATELVTEHLAGLFQSAEGGVHHFADLESLVRPDPSLRNKYLSTMLEHRSSIESLHCLIAKDRTLISVMVSAINMAIGGGIRVYNDRGAFEQALREASEAPIEQGSSLGRASL